MFPGHPGAGRCLLALVIVAVGAASWTPDAPAAMPGAALDCRQLASPGAMQVLATMPAPRVIGLNGSVPVVTMDSFARFLQSMGYPESSLRDPRDGALSMSSYTSSTTLAGIVAWHYEQSGLRPMLVGHSRGGMLVVRTLHELDGAFADSIPVHDPVADVELPRTTIIDPYTRVARPVVGLQVAFAAAIATGTWPRVLQGQWSMLSRLRQIPDTTAAFTGFTIAWDPIAGNAGEAEVYVAIGRAELRNVLLPAATSHIGAPLVEHLAADPVTRQAITDWRPGDGMPLLPAGRSDDRNLLQAAELWFSIRQHWCLEAQRRLNARGTS
ncbi:MAG: hypothetical protein ABIO63_06205 [Casimicrobiaceae bacterium]